MRSPQPVPALRARLACVSLLALTVSPTMAQAVGDWRLVAAVSTPPSRTGFALAELPNGDLLLFGGEESNSSATDWRWDGVDWHPYVASGVPRRDNGAMGKYGSYGLIVYGGTAGGFYLADTWRTQDGASWYPFPGVVQPGILTNTSMAYDPATDRMVMIGQNLQGLFTTWFYTFGTAWSAGPTFAASDARVVSDQVRGEALLLEGGFPTVSVSCLHNGDWQPVGQSQQGLSLGELAFDERRARVVLMQPFDTRDTVEWDGLAFGSSVIPTGQFVSPLTTAMSYHPARREVVFVADSGSGVKAWRHTADAAPLALAFGAPCGLGGPDPALVLAAGSSPQPGTVHRIEGSSNGVGLTLSVIGFSHTMAGGVLLPLVIPIGVTGCELLVDPAIVTVLGTSSQPSQLIAIPNVATLLAERYNAQFLVLNTQGVEASNGLELQVGLPLVEQSLVESFLSANNQDGLVSGDLWQWGSVHASRIGGDGRHGSFSPGLGVQVETNVYEINTDLTEIPASNTLDNEPAQVTDGRFYFTDFVVPAGVTVRFVGSNAPQVLVRGKTRILGKVSVDGQDAPSEVAPTGPAIGQNVSQFDAVSSLTGQPGTEGGPGAGAGGIGGDRCDNTGPTIVGGINVTNGQPGADVRVAAGHAYAAATANTGGAGSELMPATGIWAAVPPKISFVYCAYFSAGGAGGGFDTSGTSPTVPQLVSGPSTIASGPLAPGGSAFSVLPYPPSAGYSSLEHFSAGGSGGGGGGSHGYGLLAVGLPVQRWIAGHGGMGGGGAIAFRSGSDLEVAGEVSARGGSGVLITGQPITGGSSHVLGISSPSGGGSGGSVLLQSARMASVTGAVDTSGGSGSNCGLIANALLNLNANAGNGSDGYYRLEAPQAVFTGAGAPQYNASANRGQLNDADAHSGSRSKWMLPSSQGLPVYLRYELLVDIGGLPVLFSDDPAVSPLAADDPNGAVMLRFQGAKIDPQSGNALAGSAGPWRTKLVAGTDSLNADRAQAVRFDMVVNKLIGTPQVLEMRIIWR